MRLIAPDGQGPPNYKRGRRVPNRITNTMRRRAQVPQIGFLASKCKRRKCPTHGDTLSLGKNKSIIFLRMKKMFVILRITNIQINERQSIHPKTRALPRFAQAMGHPTRLAMIACSAQQPCVFWGDDMHEVLPNSEQRHCNT